MAKWLGCSALLTLGVITLSACGGATPTANPQPTQPTGPLTVSGAPPTPAPHATESNPPGDIPDQQIFVAYTPPGGHASVKIPEGWARRQTASGVTFTDKLNSITVQERAVATAATVASVTASILPQLAKDVPAFAAGAVSLVTRQGGSAVLVTYRGDSAPDPVTNKVVRDAFERYSFWRAGREVVVTLSGPQSADNVDPWKIVSDSLRWL
jgi:hypothetical protein